MPNFILPQQLNEFLETKVLDKSQIDSISKTIYKLCRDGYRPTKKKKGSEIFFSFNINYGHHAHRVIFEQVHYHNQVYFMLRDFAWVHRYLAALRWKPLVDVTDETINRLYKGLFQTIEPESEQKNDADIEPAVDEAESLEATKIYYRNNLLTPTPIQSSLLNGTNYPTILIGPPGSGKTLIAMGLLQERAIAHYESEQEETLKLLYLADNNVLVKQLERNWNDFAQHYFPQNYRTVIVSFMTVAHYEEQFVGEKERADVAIFLRNLDEKMRSELYSNAWCLEQDAKENKPYAQSLYKKIGKRSSLFTDSEKLQCYPKFIERLRVLQTGNVFIKGISSMFATEPVYDFVIVDEAQKERLTLLHSALTIAKQNQVLFIGDSFQKGEQHISGLASLAPTAKMLFALTIETKQLSNTKRLRPDVAQLTNEFILLYVNLNEGIPDASAYIEIKTDATPESAATPSVYLLPPLQLHLHDTALYTTYQANPTQFRESRQALAKANATDSKRHEQENKLALIGNDANAAAIILSDSDRRSAELLVQGSNVFNANEARGLEFSRIVFYLSESTLNEFSDLSRLMQEKNITPSSLLRVRSNLPANKTQSKIGVFRLLSDLIVALSRTQGILYVYLEEPSSKHKISFFIDWLKAKLGQTTKPVVIEAVHSSEKDWLETVNRYIEADALTQARATLKNKLGYTDETSSTYITQYRRKASLSARHVTTGDPSHQVALNVEKPKPVAQQVPDSTPKFQLAEIRSGYKQWIQQRFETINRENVELLLNSLHAAQLIFHYKMDTFCFWINLILDEKKFTEFIKLVLESKNPNIKRVFDQGLQIAIETKNHTCTLGFMLIKQHWQRFLSDSSQEICNGIKQRIDNDLNLIFYVSDTGINMLTPFINCNYFKDLPDSAFTLDNVSDIPGAYPTLLHTLIVFNCEWTLKQKYLQILIAKNILLSGRGQKNLRLLDCLLNFPSGVSFAITHIQALIANLNTAERKTFFFDAVDGYSIFFCLCFERHTEALKMYWPLLKPVLLKNPSYWFNSVTKEGYVTKEGFMGLNPLHILITNNLSFITSKWEEFEESIDARLFTPDLKGICLFQLLFKEEEGIGFVVRKWDYFKRIGSSNHFTSLTSSLIRKDNCGITPIHYMLANELGIMLIDKDWTFFEAIFTNSPDLFFKKPPLNEKQIKTPFICLCSSDKGNALLAKHWIFFKREIEKHPSCLTDTIENGALKDCRAVQLLSLFNHGIELLATEWSFFEPIIKDKPHLLFDPIRDKAPKQGMLYNFATHPKGLALIKAQWDDFATAIQGRESCLFFNVQGNGSTCLFEMLVEQGFKEQLYAISTKIYELEQMRIKITRSTQNASPHQGFRP